MIWEDINFPFSLRMYASAFRSQKRIRSHLQIFFNESISTIVILSKMSSPIQIWKIDRELNYVFAYALARRVHCICLGIWFKLPMGLVTSSLWVWCWIWATKRRRTRGGCRQRSMHIKKKSNEPKFLRYIDTHAYAHPPHDYLHAHAHGYERADARRQQA